MYYGDETYPQFSHRCLVLFDQDPHWLDRSRWSTIDDNHGTDVTCFLCMIAVLSIKRARATRESNT